MTRTKQTSEHNGTPAAGPETPTDRRVFVLDEARWQAFVRALGRPAQKKPRLARLLTKPSVLE